MASRRPLRRSKVFCIGFPNTGSTSMRAALKQLGYKTAGPLGLDQPLDALHAFALEMCLQTAQTVEAAAGEPWPLFYKELDKAFPGSKFILTTRSCEAWSKTLAHSLSEPGQAMTAFFVGEEHATADGEEHWRTVFNTHNSDVRAHFADRPDDLLCLSAEEPFLWGPICEFLGAKVPATPFPALRTKQDKTNWMRSAKKRLTAFADKLDPYVAP